MSFILDEIIIMQWLSSVEGIYIKSSNFIFSMCPILYNNACHLVIGNGIV